MKARPSFFIILLTILFSSFAFSQEAPKDKPQYGWHNELVAGLNLTQTSFDNWSKGGDNTLAWQMNLNFKFVNNQEKFNWANSGGLSYGQTKIADEEMRKSVDEFKIESVLTYKIGIYINPFVAVTGETQTLSGWDYGKSPKEKISAFMDPGYFRESFGVGYEPNTTVKTRLGFAMKQTVTDEFPARYTGDAEEKIKNEIGAESVTDVSWKINEGSLLISKLELFSNVKAFDEIDVNWDNVLTAKVSKYVNMNFNVKLIYDKDISKKRQLKQALALGLTYSFL
ncbi:DUF3078 domain-containing protein [candidate division KSB1 bacterium]|nr:DUF3078 domain-containing protein [candidate division KSB1 bacterium]